MKSALLAAFALTAASSLQAQTTTTAQTPVPATTQPAAPVDLSTATVADGSWTFATVTGGSQATFTNAAGQPQVVLSCGRTSRQVTVSRAATNAAPYIMIWTTAQTRNLLASYNPATLRLTASVNAFDPLLDAIAFSRGRIGLSAPNQATLIVPAWAEVARVVEDCRA